MDTINIIHSCMINMPMRPAQMALHDTWVERLAAFGVSGLSVAVDSLSAIKIRKGDARKG